MKIATWNLERPKKNSHKTVEIISILKTLNADIIVLTETNDFIDLGSEYHVFHTDILQDPNINYKPGERRVSIFSKYPQSESVKSFETFNAQTSICINLNTSLGELAVYGTIIGIYGNREKSFKTDLALQRIDIENVSYNKENFCFIGDFNLSFSDNYYFTKGRDKLKTTFNICGLHNYTTELKENIDHIVLTEKFVGERNIIWSEWNDTKNKQTRLSDHKGVMIEIIE